MKLTKEGIAVIEGDAYLSQWIIDKGRLDVAREELQKYRPYIPEDAIVFDVGASLGDYTATFSEMVDPLGRVHAFEPNPPTYECLVSNMKEYSNVTTYPVALGDRNRTASIIQDNHNIGASRLTNAPGAATVATLDLVDDVLKMDRLDFLKIDAEGWEPLVLDGGVRTIMKLRPVILLEVNTWPLGEMQFKPEDIWKRLDMLGYKYEKFEGPYGDVLCLPSQ